MFEFLETVKNKMMLPTVRDLGWSKTDSLPMRSFQPNVQGFTWEDYHQKMKSEYPIRYFLFETLPSLWRYIQFYFSMLRSYIKYNLIKRIHLLDLRQKSVAGGGDDYRGGYIDPREAMLYACMNVLERFISETDAENHLRWMESQVSELPEDSDERAIFEENCDLYREALAINYWWTVSRKNAYANLQLAWDNASSHEEKMSIISKEQGFDREEDEMLHRLVNIRMGLWN